MFRTLILLFIMTSVTLGDFSQTHATVEDASQQTLLKLIPAPLPAGGTAQAPASFYGPDNLYRYMDGGADIFVLYGVRTMLHLDFRVPSVDVTADIFDMGTPDTAFGMYASERSPDYQFLSIGAEGYRNEGILNFLQDRYYVKLAGFGQGADPVLETFARALSARIGANPAFPALLTKLPSKNRKPHSEQYMPNDPLGHSFLGPAYVVAYAAGDQESKMFVTLARDENDARDKLKQLEAHFSKTGVCKAAPEVAEGVIRASNSFEGNILAQVSGRYLVLLLNPQTGGEQLLKDAVKRLN